MFVSGKTTQLSLIGAVLSGPCLTSQHETLLERLVRDKHSSLVQLFKNYDRKKFYNTLPSLQHQVYDNDVDQLSILTSMKHSLLYER